MNDNYIVYMHIAPNGKKYIGITCQRPERRWRNGWGYRTMHFSRAIKKYGWDNFQHIIVADGLSLEQAKEEEIRLIELNRSNDIHFGYNVADGGDLHRKKGFHHSEETKRKIGEKQKGKKISPEAIELMRPTMFKKGHKTWNKGIPMSKEHYEKCKATMFQKGREDTNKKTIICVELNIIFKSLKEAEEKMGISRSNICQSLRGKRYKAGGYHWKYVEPEYE